MSNQLTAEVDGYQVVTGRIVSPGKFEGEPEFAPHYWDLALQGLADQDNGTAFTFKFTTMELRDPVNACLSTWLGRTRTLRMREDGQGFVRCF